MIRISPIVTGDKLIKTPTLTKRTGCLILQDDNMDLVYCEYIYHFLLFKKTVYRSLLWFGTSFFYNLHGSDLSCSCHCFGQALLLIRR
uniref:Uncharacterized protein n=1 Tax=Arundo donax TaxID=35708 RepID=A0A0A8XSX9_ARUDO